MADMKLVLAGGVALLLIAIFVMGVSLSATGAFAKFSEYRSGTSAALVASKPAINLNTPFEVQGSFSPDMKIYAPASTESVSFGASGETARIGVRLGGSPEISYMKEYMCGGFCAKKTGQIVKCEITSLQSGEKIACGCPEGFEHSGCKWIPVTSPGQ